MHYRQRLFPRACVLFACLQGLGTAKELVARRRKHAMERGQEWQEKRVRLGWLHGRWCRFKVSLMGARREAV